MIHLVRFVIEKAPGELPARRAVLYRELAEVVGDAKDAATLVALANECDSLERHCRQLRLDLGDGAKPDAN